MKKGREEGRKERRKIVRKKGVKEVMNKGPRKKTGKEESNE